MIFKFQINKYVINFIQLFIYWMFPPTSEFGKVI